MIRSFFLMPFIIAMSTGVYTASAANEREHDISCGDHRYLIKASWFSRDVSIVNINDNTAIERPYCQSDDENQMIAKLSFNGDDIWCVETFYISMDRQPVAKSSRLLSLAVGRVFEYNYLWRDSDWVKTDTQTINCTRDEEPKRRKVRD